MVPLSFMRVPRLSKIIRARSDTKRKLELLMRNIMEVSPNSLHKKVKFVPPINVNATTLTRIPTYRVLATEIHVTIMAICSSLTPIK